MNRLLKIIKNPFLIFVYFFKICQKLIILLPHFKFIRDTKGSDTQINFSTWFLQKVLGFNKAAYWPMHHSSILSYAKNVYVGINATPGYNPGCYIHAVNNIYIGDYTQFGPNVGLMSGNHDLYDYRKQIETEKPIKIGKHCWIGMGAIILPEVELGDFTIVAANAVVTKSFPEGCSVIGGVPAVKIKDLEKDKCIPFQDNVKYNGYIRSDKFDAYRKKHLNV